MIGYVGATGRATGPHLHYAFYVRGRYVNPLKMKFDDAPGIAGTRKAAYMQTAGSMRAALESAEARGHLQQRLLAKAEPAIPTSIRD